MIEGIVTTTQERWGGDERPLSEYVIVYKYIINLNYVFVNV